jgi:hypothetical protein
MTGSKSVLETIGPTYDIVFGCKNESESQLLIKTVKTGLLYQI